MKYDDFDFLLHQKELEYSVEEIINFLSLNGCKNVIIKGQIGITK
jgi:hypothetical protein